jgi:hypothetical protein
MVEVAETDVLKAAGAIYSARRRVHAGGRPKKVFRCCWCGQECRGVEELHRHQGACPHSAAAQYGL